MSGAGTFLARPLTAGVVLFSHSFALEMAANNRFLCISSSFRGRPRLVGLLIGSGRRSTNKFDHLIPTE